MPTGFLFSVKLPKAITHVRKLVDCGSLVEAFLADTQGLGDRRGPLLVQLPPSLAFDRSVAAGFFGTLRDRFDGDAACEPRHASWFGAEADALLAEMRIARVAADPARAPGADLRGGWAGLAYYRLHGSPQIYRSSYTADYLGKIAESVTAAVDAGVPAWCIFDNTTVGAAAGNALQLMGMMPGYATRAAQLPSPHP